MFDEYTSTQPIADRIKGLIHETPAKGRRPAMEALQRFERCGWHTRAFNEAVAGRLVIDENGALIHNGSDLLADVTDMLTTYLELAGCVETAIPDPMGIEDAARYLGLSIDAVKKHVHRTGQLVPMKMGHTLLFTKAMLDEFNKNKRSVGRPRKIDQK